MNESLKCGYPRCNDKAIQGRNLCNWHAPIGQKTWSENEFRTQLDLRFNSGNLDFEGYVIPISLSINNKAYSQIANFKETKFYGLVTFEGVEFRQPVFFQKAQLYAGLHLYNVRFNQSVDLSKSIFGQSQSIAPKDIAIIDCNRTQFENATNFAGSKFYGKCDLSFCSFGGEKCDFSDCLFEEGVKFNSSGFNCPYIDFGNSYFKGNLSDFTDCRFSGQLVLFSMAKFESDTLTFQNSTFENLVELSFTEAKIISRLVSFKDLKFSGKRLLFNACDFYSNYIDFSGLTVDSQLLSFEKCSIQSECSFDFCTLKSSTITFEYSKFEGPLLSFLNSNLNAIYINFGYAQINSKRFNFSGCKIDQGKVLFNFTAFMGDEVDFSLSRFGGDFVFKNNKMSASFGFNDTQFSDLAAFYFINPEFVSSPTSHQHFFFLRVRFNPFKSFFERIKSGTNYQNSTLSDKPHILFRYSNLKDVFFSENEMPIFSFYRCAFFEEAFIAKSEWSEEKDKVLSWIPWLRYKRPFLIHEDVILKEQLTGKSNILVGRDSTSDFQAEYPSRYDEVAELYIRHKTAADKAKDYNLASWFYFNEFEMKRRHLYAERDNEKSRLKKWLNKCLPSNRWLYSFYKGCAGFCEKPFWSFAWFVLVTIVFSLIHLVNGIKEEMEILPDRVINYQVFQSLSFDLTFGDFCKAFEFSILRVIPSTFIPGEHSVLSTQTNTLGDILLSLANSGILALMIVFIAIGLKRHFKRF